MLSKRDLLKAGVATTASAFLPKQATAATYADYMLNMINIERKKAGVAPLTLGTNKAAQKHAQSMVDFCYGSHWDIDGLTPYMRYSLAGGYQRNNENYYGRDYCRISDVPSTAGLGPAAMLLYQAMDSFMGSPAHKSNILDEKYKKVNIGVAHDRHNFKVVQVFEGDYLDINRMPYIRNGTLHSAGILKNGFSVGLDTKPLILVSYDPPPHLLTLGQLIRIQSYGNVNNAGEVKLILAPKAFPLRQLGIDNAVCETPYDVAEDARPPDTLEEAKSLTLASRVPCSTEGVKVPVREVDSFRLGERLYRFSIEADISDVLRQNGDGVYTITMLSYEQKMVVWQYSIFHDVEPPAGYLGL